LKLNSSFLNLLPKFNGLSGKDPRMHLKESLVVCSTMRPDEIDEDQVELHAFLFSLHNLAKDWLYNLPPGSVTGWTQLQKSFLEKIFPVSRICAIRKQICGIRQNLNESLYEY